MKINGLITGSLFFIVVLLLTGCKYEDGPFISFRSKKERLVNEWKLEKYLWNGKDRTDRLVIQNYQETYKEDGTLQRTFTESDGDQGDQDGEWSFEDNKKVVDIKDVGSIPLTPENSTVSTSEITILKLKEKELWYKFENGGDVHEFHMVDK